MRQSSPPFTPMRTTLRFLPLLLLPALLTSPAWTRDRSARTAFDPATIHAQIAYLASDALRGRESGEPGNEKAAQFIAQEFARDGLKPLGTARENDPRAKMNGSGYFEPFTFIAGHMVGHDNLLAATIKGHAHTYRFNVDYRPSGASSGGKAEGPLVFVGYGIHAPQANHDDFAKSDVHGKILLLLAGSPNNDPHSALAEYADIRRKASAARDLGALAVLVVPPKDNDSMKPARFEYASQYDAGLPVVRVSRKVAAELLQTLTAQPSLEDWERAANAEQNVSTETTIQMRLVADVKKQEKVTANVIGLIEGSDPALKNEYIVIGGHLDHLGMGGPYSLARSDKPAIHHGADDNASGAAGVMALARYFGQPKKAGSEPGSSAPPVRLKRSLILMCFSGEELGLLGSDHYVNHPIIPLAKTVAMLNMDMIGRLRENKLIVIGSASSPEFDSLIDAANKATGLTLARSAGDFGGGSDHESFSNKEVPVLFFFTGSHEDYHTPTDTADKINAEGESKVLEVVAACAEKIADTTERPAFQHVAAPTQPGGAPGFRVYFGSVPDYAAMVEGVRLNGVRDNSPAAKAGLMAGDVIIKFGDRTVKNVEDYTYALQDHKPGDVVSIVIKRGDQTLTLTATLASRKE